MTAVKRLQPSDVIPWKQLAELTPDDFVIDNVTDTNFMRVANFSINKAGFPNRLVFDTPILRACMGVSKVDYKDASNRGPYSRDTKPVPETTKLSVPLALDDTFEDIEQFRVVLESVYDALLRVFISQKEKVYGENIDGPSRLAFPDFFYSMLKRGKKGIDNKPLWSDMIVPKVPISSSSGKGSYNILTRFYDSSMKIMSNPEQELERNDYCRAVIEHSSYSIIKSTRMIYPIARIIDCVCVSPQDQEAYKEANRELFISKRADILPTETDKPLLSFDFK